MGTVNLGQGSQCRDSASDEKLSANVAFFSVVNDFGCGQIEETFNVGETDMTMEEDTEAEMRDTRWRPAV